MSGESREDGVRRRDRVTRGFGEIFLPLSSCFSPCAYLLTTSASSCHAATSA
jgi:hypothetical protein